MSGIVPGTWSETADLSGGTGTVTSVASGGAPIVISGTPTIAPIVTFSGTKAEVNAAITDGAFISAVVDDVLPVLGGPLDGSLVLQSNIGNFNIVGQKVAYLNGDSPLNLIEMNTNHTYDNNNAPGGGGGVLMPAAVSFVGNHDLLRAGGTFALGFLFQNKPTIRSTVGMTGTTNNTGMFTCNASPTYQTIANAPMTVATQIDFQSITTFTGNATAGTMTSTHYSGYVSSAVYNANSAGTNRTGFVVNPRTGAGSLVNQCGLAVLSLTASSTNSVGLLLGAAGGVNNPTIPSGHWGINQVGTSPNRFNGGDMQPYHVFNGVTATLTTANRIVHLIGATATTSFPASTAGTKGLRYTVKNDRATTQTMTSTSTFFPDIPVGASADIFSGEAKTYIANGADVWSLISNN